MAWIISLPSNCWISRVRDQGSSPEKRKLATEREILRQAAKYFAGETNW